MKPIQASTRHRPPRQAITTLAIAAAVVLSGCASPYVALEKRPELDASRPVTLPTAISDARNVQTQYRAKVVELGEAERALSNSLLGLGTLIVGLGVAEVHSSAIRGAVLGTGAVYTIGTANTDKRRAQIYIAGMKALDCAVDAVTPLVINDELKKQLNTEMAAVSTAVDDLGPAVGKAEAWVAQARLNDATKFQTAIDATVLALAAAQSAVGQANAAADLATQRLYKPDQIARDLSNAVSSIDRAVLDEIRGTENAVQAVPTILASLQSNAALFSLQSLAPNLVPQPATTDELKARNAKQGKNQALATPNVAKRNRETLGGLAEALGQLRHRTVVLASRADRLSKAATAQSTQAVTDAVKGCEVKGTVKSITAEPTSVNFAAKTAGTQLIMVKGGNGNYTAAFLQSPVPGLTATIRPRSNGVVEVVATNQTMAGGSYQLFIEDTTLTSRQVVTVTIAAAVTTEAPEIQSEQDVAVELINKASPLKINGVSVTLTATPQDDGVKVDYSTADATITDAQVRAAVMAIDKVKNNIGSDEALFAVNKVTAKSGTQKKKAKGDDGGSVVAALDVSERRLIQGRLCMPSNKIKDTWSDDAQAALQYDREHRRNGAAAPGRKEMLTGDEKKALFDLTEAKAAVRCKRP